MTRIHHLPVAPPAGPTGNSAKDIETRRESPDNNSRACEKVDSQLECHKNHKSANMSNSSQLHVLAPVEAPRDSVRPFAYVRTRVCACDSSCDMRCAREETASQCILKNVGFFFFRWRA